MEVEQRKAWQRRDDSEYIKRKVLIEEVCIRIDMNKIGTSDMRLRVFTDLIYNVLTSIFLLRDGISSFMKEV